MKISFLEFMLKLLRDESGNISLTGGESSGSPDSDVSGNDPVSGEGEPEEAPSSAADGDPASGESANAPQFPSDLPDDIKGDPSLKVFLNDKGEINYANLMKSYVHAQKKMGEKGIRVPDKYATEEDWKNFYDQIRPSELDKYEVKSNLPEGQVLDEGMFNSFKELAHKSGLTTKQAQDLLDWYNTSTLGAQEAVQNQQKDVYEKEVKQLKDDWGEGFDNQLKLSQRAIKEFADPETLEYFKKTGLDGNVQLIKLFNKIGKGLMEDKFDQESHGNFGVTKQDAQKKIDAVMSDLKHPYFDKNHPGHKMAVEEVSKLMEATI